MRRVVCPGSFDPVTLGHLDIVTRAAGLFDEVIVAVGSNVSKTALFSPAERVELLERATAQLPGVSVELFSGLVVDFCRAREAVAVVKGVRNAGDLDHELPMAQMNTHLAGLETVLLPTAPQWSFVSSSLVREVAMLGGDVTAFLTSEVAAATLAKVRSR